LFFFVFSRAADDIHKNCRFFVPDLVQSNRIWPSRAGFSYLPEKSLCCLHLFLNGVVGDTTFRAQRRLQYVLPMLVLVERNKNNAGGR
jgi:hypothetical protein